MRLDLYYYPECWPNVDFIRMPYGQLQSVTSIKYTDTSETEVEFPDPPLLVVDYYLADIDSDPGRVVLRYGKTWPTTTLSPSNPIVIEYICGYGLTGSTVEAPIKHAIKLMVSDLYENRESILVGTISSKSKAIESLLFPFKIHEVFI
jgi:hypothetical protein